MSKFQIEQSKSWPSRLKISVKNNFMLRNSLCALHLCVSTKLAKMKEYSYGGIQLVRTQREGEGVSKFRTNLYRGSGG